jgi:hypothetical protein
MDTDGFYPLYSLSLLWENMQIEDTPYGTLFIESTPRVGGLLQAVLKGLSWTKEIELESDLWRADRTMEHGVRLTRTYKGCSISVYPLVAATLDVGGRFRTFQPDHIPVQVNGANVCVQWKKPSRNKYHIDAVASFIKLFSMREPPLKAIPKTISHQLNRAVLGLELSRDTTEVSRLIDSLLPQCGGSANDAIDFIDETYTAAEWSILREEFPWQRFDSLALDIALRFLSSGHNLGNLRWAVKIVRHFQPATLRSLLRSRNTSVALYAISAFEVECPDEAWNLLSRFLDEDNILGLTVHQKLVPHPALSGRLRDFWSLKLREHRLANPALRQTVESWYYFQQSHSSLYA